LVQSCGRDRSKSQDPRRKWDLLYNLNMAETPPLYAPRRKSNTTTVIFVILGVCALCCILCVVFFAGAGWFAFKRTKGTIACAIGFGEASEALKAYVKDHKDTLPKADHWQDDLRPYFEKQQKKDEDQGVKMLGSFDAEGVWTCKDESGQGTGTGVAFNSDLSGAKMSDIKNKSTTVILFETPKSGMNLNEPYVELNRNESPRVFGKPRGWFFVTADYEIGGTDKNNNTINFKAD